LDQESLTELQIAWDSDQTDRLLNGTGKGVALRSLWAVKESARALPDAEVLQTLAAAATKRSRATIDRVLETQQEASNDVEAEPAVFYAGLAMRDDTDLREQALALLTGRQADQAELSAMEVLARTLLGQPDGEDQQALIELIDGEVNGDDLVTLTALAARRSGGDAWQAFRRQMQELLGKQPLSGSVVVLVNRLGQPALPLVAQR
jgi:hypothetical protein